jgi:hypothetical protein
MRKQLGEQARNAYILAIRLARRGEEGGETKILMVETSSCIAHCESCSRKPRQRRRMNDDDEKILRKASCRKQIDE